jgi:hypothetical protein
MVSFTAINNIASQLKWPDRLQTLLNTVYAKGKITAKVRANGVTSERAFKVNSGTRQGCPLSPLIYAIVADLFNMAIIKHPQYMGHMVSEGCFSKISAYADDTTVHVGCRRDITIYRYLLAQYARATGGITNFGKSEAVLLGSWRNTNINMGVRLVASSKYLGVITGRDLGACTKAIADREAKVYAQLDYWDRRLSSSPIDRAMVAKIMCLSILWYHAGLMPGWEDTLDRIDKRVNSFIWKDSVPKVAKSTLVRDKDLGGLNMWMLNAKAAAFRNVWIVKLLSGELNPILTATLRAISSCMNNEQRCTSISGSHGWITALLLRQL